MVKYLLTRPIGTCVVAVALMVSGIITMHMLPVSLLPNIPVPEITIKVQLEGADASQIQQVVALPLRNQLLQLNHLNDLEATSRDERVDIKLRFDYGTNVDLAYLETNEKIDALMSQLPGEISRPVVIKAGAADIPVFQLNVTPKNGDSTSFAQVSELCENVLKRRLEQLSDVALTDITGQVVPVVMIRADLLRMQSTGLQPADIIKALNDRNIESTNVTVREGVYEYSVRLGAPLKKTDDILNTYLSVGKEPERIIRLGEIATVDIEEKEQEGIHTFNGKRAIAMAIIKKSDARLIHLRKELRKQTDVFKKDYPSLEFDISQDQTELLNLSISNLISSLLTGAMLTIIMIFFFMKDLRVLLIIALVIPVSLTITMLGFYVLGISVNIVSLAGLILGIGEIIDSAIIIIENIGQHQGKGKTFSQACADGAEEVIKPLFTSIMTNSAVFLPLLFLSGIAGALFWDQAVAVTLSLGASLLTSYILVPVLCSLLLRTGIKEGKTKTMLTFTRLYERIFRISFRFPKTMFLMWLILLAIGIVIGTDIKKSGMPDLSRTELELALDWNEPITVQESNIRVKSITNHLPVNPVSVNGYVGAQQFLLNARDQQSNSEALVVIKMKDPDNYPVIQAELTDFLRKKYPLAAFQIRPGQNVFEQLFRTNEAPLQIRIFDNKTQNAPHKDQTDKFLSLLRKEKVEVLPVQERSRILLEPNWNLLASYKIEPGTLLQSLQTAFNQNNAGVLKSDQRRIPIILANASESGLNEILRSLTVVNKDNQSYPVNSLVNYRVENEYSSLSLGKEGAFTALSPVNKNQDLEDMQQAAQKAALSTENLAVEFVGSYFRNNAYLKELVIVVIIAVLMLFFILAAQFESLLQPFIVLLTIVFGTTGAMAGLYWMGESLNIMSATGFIVLIGLLDNDSILKLDTMNKSRDQLSLMDSIKEGGYRRLQSQLMTYMTTVLGLLPIFWSIGLGAELQRPLAISVVFGMSLGVIVSWTFIPLMYYLLHRKRNFSIQRTNLQNP